METIQGTAAALPTLPVINMSSLIPTLGFSDTVPSAAPPDSNIVMDKPEGDAVSFEGVIAPMGIPSLEELRSKFEELDTKTIILGMAGVLTLVLIFKK